MKKWLRRIGLSIVALLVLAVTGLFLTGNGHVVYGLRGTYLIGKKTPDIDDRSLFHTSVIPADHPEPWPQAAAFHSAGGLSEDGRRRLDSLETTAFLVFRRDSLLYEEYWPGTTAATDINSFSMAKSFVGLLVGIALDEGFIDSLDQAVGDFLPAFREGRNASLTIRHLLTMSSGIPFGESYNDPFGYMARAYYGRNLAEETMKFRVEQDPGAVWSYEGGNTVLLGMILHEATGRSVSEYFFEKVWSCVGAETPAYWNLDREGGLEKAYTGVYATPRDFARIGALYLHSGVWGPDTIVSPEFVRASLTPCLVPDPSGELCTWYGFHWWLGEVDGVPFFGCRGLRGQYVVVIPSEQIVVVRTGHQQMKQRIAHMPPDLLTCVREARRIAGQ